MDQLNCHITTFNCGRSEIDIEYFASSLRTSFKKSPAPPDIAVLALEELAPIGHSFLGGFLLEPYFSSLRKATRRALHSQYGAEVQYREVVARNVGMMGILVLARDPVFDAIRSIAEAGTGVGFWDMGNKGAVGVRISIDAGVLRDGAASGEEGRNVLLTFVAAHLAPLETKWERRNQDWKQISQDLVFRPISTGLTPKRSNDEPSDASDSEPLLASSNRQSDSSSHTSDADGIFYPPSYVFFAGDLNYRTSDQQPGKKDHEIWPQPMSSDDGPSHFNKLLQHDQLKREISKGATLHHLAEAPIRFPPTYKYSSRAQKLAAEDAARHAHRPDSAPNEEQNDGAKFSALDGIQEQVWLWAKHRIPSWCDRILFLAGAPPEVHSYMALPVQPTSDHRPVVLACSIPLQALSDEQAIRSPYFKVQKGWEARRSHARRLEILVGVGAVLGFTVPGRLVMLATMLGVVGGYLIMKSLVA